MKKTHRWFALWLLVISGLILLTLNCLAQAAGAPASGPAAPAAATANWALLLIPVIVPVIIALLKMLVTYFGSKIPKIWIPIMAPILGAAVGLLLDHTWGTGTIMAAVAGSAGVGLREIVDQVKALNPPTT